MLKKFTQYIKENNIDYQLLLFEDIEFLFLKIEDLDHNVRIFNNDDISYEFNQYFLGYGVLIDDFFSKELINTPYIKK
jgi:hypothetical protein